jgi:hypothetical protein
MISGMPAGEVVPTRWELAAPDVVSDVLDDEAVIINLDTGVYFQAVGDASRTWVSIIGGADTSVDLDPGRRDELDGFIALLIGHGLVRARSGSDGTVAELPAWAPGSLILDSHEDLQDLLALDPVHDVESAVGWPRQPTA